MVSSRSEWLWLAWQGGCYKWLSWSKKKYCLPASSHPPPSSHAPRWICGLRANSSTSWFPPSVFLCSIQLHKPYAACLVLSICIYEYSKVKVLWRTRETVCTICQTKSISLSPLHYMLSQSIEKTFESDPEMWRRLFVATPFHAVLRYSFSMAGSKKNKLKKTV